MRIAVLGAGMQGACIALELARLGHSVDLFDRRAVPLSGAASNNEGKIHLGFVYGQDRSLRTARLMARGAVAFAPLMRRWLGNGAALTVSDPFRYVVLHASLLSPDEVERYFHAVTGILAEATTVAGADYFGRDLRESFRKLDRAELESEFDPRHVTAAFTTPEIAIDPVRLAEAMRERLASEPAISLHLGATILGVDTNGDRPSVRFEAGGEVGSQPFDHVVNALWAGRLAIDQTVGIRPERPWSFRLKYGSRLQLKSEDSAIPSVTAVLGPFGDVVNYGHGLLYVSWYPSGRRAISSELKPPDWPPSPSAPVAEDIRSKSLAALSAFVPSLRGLGSDHFAEAREIGGAIFAWGNTDVDDPASELHRRYQIGVHSYGHYHSVDPGKLTLAPHFAVEAAARIDEAG